MATARPRKEKNLIENIEKYEPEGDFSEEEKLQYLVNLTGVFPISAVVTPRVREKLDELYIPPISEFDPSLGVTWFIPRECKLKKSKNGKNFYVVKVIDDNNETTTIRCWGVDPKRMWSILIDHTWPDSSMNQIGASLHSALEKCLSYWHKGEIKWQD